jgi:hypothetical protein
MHQGGLHSNKWCKVQAERALKHPTDVVFYTATCENFRDQSVVWPISCSCCIIVFDFVSQAAYLDQTVITKELWFFNKDPIFAKSCLLGRLIKQIDVQAAGGTPPSHVETRSRLEYQENDLNSAIAQLLLRNQDLLTHMHAVLHRAL